MTLPVSTALALCLITSPELAPDSVNHLSHLSPVVADLAESLELLDPRERRFTLTREEDWASDLKCIQERHAELWNAPRLIEVERFPCRCTTQGVREFNQAYRAHLDRELSLSPERAAEIHEVMVEAKALYKIWDLVDDARIGHYYITTRRRALAELRSRIGEADFYAGILPDPIPRWRLISVD